MMCILPDNMVAGGFLVVAGLAALLRQSLLEPDSPRYPKAPAWLRLCMFAFAVVLIFTGLHIMSAEHSTGGPFQLLAVSIALYNIAMLGNLVRQRYPEDVWERLNRMNDRLCCQTTPLYKWLSK